MGNICIRCNGKREYLGNGFMMTDCELCLEKDNEKETIALDKINRNSKSYLQAIREIMASNPDVSRKEAIKIFDEAYQRA